MMKKLLLSIIIFVVICGLFISKNTFAEDGVTLGMTFTGTEVNITDKETVKYLRKAAATEDYTQKQANLMYAFNTHNKLSMTEENVKASAVININIGDNALKNNDFNTAMKAYLKTYVFLKKSDLYKNEPIAFYCLLSAMEISRQMDSKKWYEFCIKEIEQNEIALDTKYPEQFTAIYNNLSKIYYLENNKEKSNLYAQKVKKLH